MLYLLGLSAIAVFGLFVYDIYKTQDKMQDQINRLSIKRNNNKDVPLVETGYLDPKHLLKGYPKICQHCDRLDLVVHEDMCYACIAGEQGVDW